jgi:dolichol-phosphate mannosyltransferase
MQSSSEFRPPDLVVVMPVYNEGPNITAVIRDWFDSLANAVPHFQLLAVNDGSSDDSAQILDRLAVQLGSRLRVVHKQNSGHGRSCRYGYELALTEGARWILQIDSDGQCDPAYFSALYHNRAEHDCVFAYRQTRDDGVGRVFVSGCCRTLLWMISGAYLKDPNVPYRLIKATALRSALRNIPADFNLQNIALTFRLKRNRALRWNYVAIHFRARQGGENSINYRKIAKMGIDFLRDFRRITHEDSHTRWWPDWARRRMAS